MIADDGTYFWLESDGWRVAVGHAIIGPFATFDAALKRWRLIRLSADRPNMLLHPRRLWPIDSGWMAQ
jgi:hypothetical protein